MLCYFLFDLFLMFLVWCWGFEVLCSLGCVNGGVRSFGSGNVGGEVRVRVMVWDGWVLLGFGRWLGEEDNLDVVVFEVVGVGDVGVGGVGLLICFWFWFSLLDCWFEEGGGGGGGLYKELWVVICIDCKCDIFFFLIYGLCLCLCMVVDVECGECRFWWGFLFLIEYDVYWLICMNYVMVW